jgi:hypothetical protein
MLKVTSRNTKLFNEKILEYFYFLESVINDTYAKKKINKSINKIKLGLKIDPNMIIKLFYEKIYPHNIKINNENEEVLEVFGIYLFDNKIDFKQLWKTINKTDQESIWKYLKIFVLLCEQK